MSTATDSSAWRPLRERMAGATGERALVEGTPEYLLSLLRHWLTTAAERSVTLDVFEGPTSLALLLQLRLRRTQIFVSGNLVMVEGEDLLEAIDATLDLYRPLLDAQDDPTAVGWWVRMIGRLRNTLERGGSAWTVADDASGLARRVDETVAQAARATMQAAPSGPAGHLRRAWDAAYGLNPDATKAYSEAVKAVEAVVIPHTIPNDQVATLGKAITHIKNTAAKWSIAVDQSGSPASADVLIGMLGLVWRGQSDRHAGPNTSPVTLESAQTALHAAVTLVQWFTSGAVKKSP